MFKNILRGSAILSLIFAVSLPAAAQTAPVTNAQILHFLNRISYGPTPGEIEAVRRIGMSEYLDKQLHPRELSLPEALASRLENLSTQNASLMDLAVEYGPPPGGKKDLSADEKKELAEKQKTILLEASEAKILRAVASPAQLQEVMTDFWFNHFNVFYGKGADRVFTGAYERDAIRPYALGKFSDLLMATALHPAMLFYLDNWENTDPNSPFARKAEQKAGKKLGINENYARELMELHTLGVDGGYTQDDVTTLAHILTGWGLERGPGFDNKANFMFDPQRHDWDDQQFLGQHIQGGGREEVERVIDMLAHQPATAHHIAYELAQYFVADQPPAPLVSRLADVFTNSDGDIAAVLRELFGSPEFWDPKYAQNKFKPPFRYVVSTLRASGVFPPGDTKKLQAAIAQMGEPLYRCQTPNGYSNTNDQWLNSDAVLKRITFAKNYMQAIDPSSAQNIQASLANNWSANTLKTVDESDPGLRPALLLGSPEFLYY